MIVLWYIPQGILHLNSQLPILALGPLLKKLVFTCIIQLNKLHHDSIIFPGLEKLASCLCNLIFPVEEMRNIEVGTFIHQNSPI